MGDLDMTFEIAYKKAGRLKDTEEVLARYPELLPYRLSSKMVCCEDGTQYLEILVDLQTLEELNALRQLCKRCITIEMHPKSQDIPFLEFRD